MAECTIVLDGDFKDHESTVILSRLGRLAPSRAFELPSAPARDRLKILAELVAQATAPVLLVDSRYTGHDSPLIDVLGAPSSASTVLEGIEGIAWPAEVVQGVVRASGSQVHSVSVSTARVGGALRIGVEDRNEAAQAIRRMAGAIATEGWAVDDLLPVVLVAMARSGVRVETVPVRGFVAAVPASDEERRQVAERLRESNEHQLRLVGAARDADGFYSTFVVRRLSRWATALALHLRVTPNQVTLASFGIALFAMGAFAIGTRGWLVAGALLLQLSLIVDCVDGELARYTRLHSALGAWLDAGTDRVKEFGIYAALAVGASRSGDTIWLLAIAVLAIQVTRHFVDFGFALRQAERKRDATTPLALPLEAVSDDLVHDGEIPVSGFAARWGRSATDLSERTNQVDTLVWLKRALIMPIGERWLVISLAAAFVGPRLALTVLLALGVVAAVYTTTGRVLRSAASSTRPLREVSQLKALVDLGLLTDLVPEDRLAGRFGWLAPATSRALEYGVALASCAIVAPAWLPVGFAYLFVLSIWHYDAVYRLRFTGKASRPLMQRLALGAAARCAIVLGAAMAGPDALAVGLAGLGLLVLTVTVADSSIAWRRWLIDHGGGFSVPRFRVVSVP